MLQRLSSIPSKPGVYLFKDSRDTVLYVGKAKNLRNRIKGYFGKGPACDPRKASMIKDAADFSAIVTGNELEAFVLEANLIKQHKPRFNVVLRDDKNYPYLKLNIRDEWPGIEVTRTIKKDGALYFGPYIPAGALRDILAFIRRNFQIRHCRGSFQKQNRPCMQHQMGRCVAPCAGYVSREEYERLIDEVRLFLSGKKDDLIAHLEKRMRGLSDEMKYEEAAGMRDRIRSVRRAMDSQKIISPELGDIDVIGFHQEDRETLFAVFFIRSGRMIGSRDFHMRTPGIIPERELLRMFIMQFYSGEIIPPAEILTPAIPDEAGSLERWLGKRMGKKVRFPKHVKGKKKDLIAMAAENALLAFNKRKAQTTHDVLREIQERLDLSCAPESIGAFDISNISGNEAVGAFVSWEDGAFNKECYRRLRISSAAGIDDYLMMKELIVRVLKHLQGKSPSLLIIDGGKGHLETAGKAVAEAGAFLKRKPDIVAVAKDPDRVFLASPGPPVNLGDRSPSSLLLISIRDEAHRVAVGYHRKMRGKSLLTSPLDNIPGIGTKRRLELLRAFGSVENIKSAGFEAIAGLKGFNRRIADRLLKELKQ